MSQKEHFIQQFDLSGSLPQEILASLQFRHVEKAEYLCHQGDELESFYFLVHGKVQVDAFHLDGKQAVFSFETPLAIIGDVELLEHKAVMCNVQATQDSAVLFAPATLIRQYAYQNIPFLLFMSKHLSEKLRAVTFLQTTAQLPLEHRLVRYLTHRATQEGTTFLLEKRDALASMFGASERHLNRSLRRLELQEFITLKNKTLHIQDFQRLREHSFNLA